MPTKTVTLIEVSGHLIDSLTLAKVIDKIMAAGCEYQINEIQIGKNKQDLSYVRIALWTESDRDLEAILAELKDYGAKVHPYQSASFAPCPADGQPPANFFPVISPRCQVLVQSQWIEAEDGEIQEVIVINADYKKARVQSIRNLKQGDLVVVGREGVQILSATN